MDNAFEEPVDNASPHVEVGDKLDELVLALLHQNVPGMVGERIVGCFAVVHAVALVASEARCEGQRVKVELC